MDNSIFFHSNFSDVNEAPVITSASTFLQAMDFEKPVDSDSNNAYKVKVQVSDEAGLVATQNLAVNRTDAKETSTPPESVHQPIVRSIQ